MADDTATQTAAVETPSGKGAADENFPVGSFLLAAPLRPHVAAYYAFARAIDDIADNPDLAPDDKIARLDRFAAALSGEEASDPALEKACRLRRSMAKAGVPERHGLDLVAAFKQDATKLRYTDWEDLLGYCELSANPVGRFLLDLHGEERSGWAASDALCSALQVINHLQDMQDDYRNLDRVYVPLDWLQAEGLDVTVLDGPRCDPAMRRVLDRCLDGVEDLIAQARPLPAQLRSTRLAMESAAIIKLAAVLTGRLRRQDPLARRVALSRPGLVAVAGLGALGHLLGRLLGGRRPAPDASAWAHVDHVVARSKSSFIAGMRALPRDRSRAMYAVYAFCREVDDIADEPGDFGRRLEQLAEWRAEIERLYAGAPIYPTTRALLGPVEAFKLPKAEFLAVIDGMESDLRNAIRAPSAAALRTYCRQVAGAVGMLSVNIFGADEPEAQELAEVLGEALQLTNILRDLAEDGARGRLYLPRELLLQHGIDSDDPETVLAHPALPRVCAALAEQARKQFRRARLLMGRCNRERLKPSVLMMEVYERILTRLEQEAWRDPRRRVRLSAPAKLWILLRHGLA